MLFAIGDVTGHGIEAAVTMNRARQTLMPRRCSIRSGLDLSRVNADVAKQDMRLVTAIAGLADASAYEFSYASAGHPPPVLLEPGRPPRFLECGSVPLGASNSPVYVTRRVQSMPGATLVLYTDGAVEHSRNVLEGEALLLEAVAQAGEQAEVDPAAFIHRAIFSGRSVGDDVAILTIAFATVREAGLLVSGHKGQAHFSGHVDGPSGAAQPVKRPLKAVFLPAAPLERIAS